MDKELENILSNIKVNEEKIDIERNKYTGEKRTYATWTILDENPALAYEDKIQYSVVTVDIDIYSNKNYLEIMKEIKEKMGNNEWIWTGDSEEKKEEDTGLYHRTSTFEKERKV